MLRFVAAAGCVLGLMGCAGSQRQDTTVTRERDLAAGIQTRSAPIALRGTVTRVVDGDTIKIEAQGFETTVRLLGIDTPETRTPGGDVQCFGPAATRRAELLLPAGRTVRLVTDPSQDVRDRYGRLLAYVFTEGTSGPAGSVNHALVASGHARVYVYRGNPFRHTAAFRAAETRARRQRLGLWGAPCNGDTTKPDRAASS